MKQFWRKKVRSWGTIPGKGHCQIGRKTWRYVKRKALNFDEDGTCHDDIWMVYENLLSMGLKSGIIEKMCFSCPWEAATK